ncbi:hypothetical protein DID73_01710 [Candidatus Marinamargulisbacteria bacterium SCGC AG-343-K17]|nr:hypothetical protein DID73_01710 [Candidatus Marinamargulisbacteria bacterium SCGC AG-343-K17]
MGQLIRKTLILMVILFFTPSVVYPSFNDGLYLSTMMGCSKSGRSPLTIKYDDRQHESISARYNNRCLDDSHWWSIRVENWTNQTGWGLELIHHKIYLANTTDNLTSFSISDGYNLLLFNFVKQVNDINYRIGFGGVLGHMDAHVSGRDRYIRKGFKGHYLTGPAFQINVEKIIWQSDTHFISFDSKFTAAYAEVPISSNNNELAIAPDHAVHFSLALGSKPEALTSAKKNYHKAWYFAPLVYPAIVGRLIGTGVLPDTY